MRLNWNRTIGASLFLLTAGGVASAAQAADIGVVAVAQSDVRLQLSGETKSRRIGAMQSLPENSRLLVGAGSRAVVVIYKDGARFSLPAGSVATFSDAGLKTEVGKATALPSLKIQQAKVLRNSRIAYGRSASVVVRGHNHIELKKLLSGATLQTRPTFEWTAVPGAASYQVRLLGGDDKVIFERETIESQLTLPAEVADLQPSVEYLWSVSTVLGDDKYSDEGTFHLIAPKDKKDVESELAALQIDATNDADDQVMNGALRAEIYRRYNLFDEAVSIYEQLLDKNPDSAALHAALSEVFTGQNRIEASKLHRDKAIQLENGEEEKS